MTCSLRMDVYAFDEYRRGCFNDLSQYPQENEHALRQACFGSTPATKNRATSNPRALL